MPERSETACKMRELLVAVDHQNVAATFTLAQLHTRLATALKNALPWLKNHGYITELANGTRFRITSTGHRFMGQPFVHEDEDDDTQHNVTPPKKQEDGPGE